jgi:UDPglucose 6-dehydrogenase
MGRRVVKAMGSVVRGKTVAILGLTFKPNTDDMRDAPSLSIIQALQDEGAQVRAYDPEGIDQAKLILNNVEFSEDVYSCVKGASAVVIVTEWNEFRALDMVRVKDLMSEPILVDLRNVYDPYRMHAAGFTYSGIGRNIDAI